MDGVIRFMQVNGFTLSTQKTVFLPFHISSRRILDISVKVNDELVFPADKVKYLGVVFQRMGRTNRHVDHNARNASCALNVIKVLSTQPWVPPKVLVLLVMSLVRSRLVYDLEAMPSITETGLKRLTAIEVRVRLLARGLPQSVPHSLRYRDVGLLPLIDQLQLIAAKYVFRSQTVDYSTVEEVSGSFGRGPTLVPCCSSICDLVADLVEGAGLDGASAADRLLHPYSPG